MKKPPKEPVMNVNQAQLKDAAGLLKMGLFAEAARSFDKILAKSPTDVASLLGKSQALLSQGDYKNAQAALREVLKASPNHPIAVGHLARFRAEKGDARALQALRQLAAAPSATFGEHMNLASALLAVGQLEEAQKAAVDAVKAMPKSPYALTLLGQISQRRGLMPRAIACFKKAAAMNKKQVHPLVLLADAHAARGDAASAFKAVTEGLSRAPQNVTLLGKAVELNLALGQPKAAIASAISLRMKAPNDAQATYLHGLSLLVAGMGPDAKRVLEEAHKLAPKSAEILVALARVEVLAKNVDRAVKLLETAVALDPSKVGPACDLAHAHLRKGDAAKAEAVLASALEAHPEDPALNLNMAIALGKKAPKKAKEHAALAQASGDEAIREQAARLLKN